MKHGSDQATAELPGQADARLATSVKIEEYDGSYACAICWESVRGDLDVLHCSQCRSNPIHRACGAAAGFLNTCQACGRDGTMVAWTKDVGASGSESGAHVDLTKRAQKPTKKAARMKMQKRPAAKKAIAVKKPAAKMAAAAKKAAATNAEGPSFVEMLGLQEGDSVFKILGGGFIIMNPDGSGKMVQPNAQGPDVSALDKHPALRQKVEELEELHHDCKYGSNWRPLVKKSKEVDDVADQLEKLAKKLKDKGKKSGLLSTASDLCCRQAIALRSEEKHAESLKQAKKALELAREADDEEGEAYALSGLGDALDSCGQYQEAIEAYEQRCDIAQRHDDWDGFHTGLRKLVVTHVSVWHARSRE